MLLSHESELFTVHLNMQKFKQINSFRNDQSFSEAKAPSPKISKEKFEILVDGSNSLMVRDPTFKNLTGNIFSQEKFEYFSL